MKKRQILLYEAFQAKSISKTIAFLGKLVSKREADKFIEALKKLMKLVISVILGQVILNMSI